MKNYRETNDMSIKSYGGNKNQTSADYCMYLSVQMAYRLNESSLNKDVSV